MSRGMRHLTKYLAYKMEENSSTSEHVLRMSEYYNRLNQVRPLTSIAQNVYARDDENDSRALRDAEIDEGRNQEKHQMLMVDKTTSFK